MNYRDPRRPRKKFSPAVERMIYWLSPHERARRKTGQRAQQVYGGCPWPDHHVNAPVLIPRTGQESFRRKQGRDSGVFANDDGTFTVLSYPPFPPKVFMSRIQALRYSRGETG